MHDQTTKVLASKVAGFGPINSPRSLGIPPRLCYPSAPQDGVVSGRTYPPPPDPGRPSLGPTIPGHDLGQTANNANMCQNRIPDLCQSMLEPLQVLLGIPR